MLKSNKNSVGQVRIIGGKWRGRKLEVLNSLGLRPTTDRVKETVFNWLTGELSQRRCLDCFAGSGSLGLEALSRYANVVYFIESNRKVYQQLKQNIQQLKAEPETEVVCADTLQWLSQTGQPFDVVFVDPPFRCDLLEKTLWLLENNGWLADNAWIYVECETEAAKMTPHPPTNWQLYREKIAGQVCYRLYYRELKS